MRVVVVADGFAHVAFEAVHGEVHAREGDGRADFFVAVNGELARRVFPMLGDEARALHEHAARAAGRIEDAAVIRLQHFDDEADDAGGRVKFAALRALGAGEFAEEVFVDAAEGVVIEAARESPRRA